MERENRKEAHPNRSSGNSVASTALGPVLSPVLGPVLGVGLIDRTLSCSLLAAFALVTLNVNAWASPFHRAQGGETAKVSAAEQDLTFLRGLDERALEWRPLSPKTIPAVGWASFEIEDAFRQQSGRLSSTDPAPVRAPGVAFLMSAVLPGAGQLYNGNQRGYLFLAIEAGAWFARSSYIDAGNKKEGEFEAFARRHWDYDRFRDSAGSDGCLWTAEADSLIRAYESGDLEQYYEELATSDLYRCGWDDFEANFDPDNPDVLNPRRDDYRSQRAKSNDLKDKAGFALGVMVLNRVVSAVDAFRVARSRNRGEGNPGLRLHGDVDLLGETTRAEFRLVKEIP